MKIPFCERTGAHAQNFCEHCEHLYRAAPYLLEAAKLALMTLDEAGRGQSQAAHALSAALAKAGAL